MRKSILVFSLVSTIASGASAANLLSNGSFETPIGGPITIFPVGSAGITGWTVTGPAGSNIAILSNGVGGITADDGSQFLDLTGTLDGQNIYGGVSQTINTVDGQAYRLTFALGNYATNPAATSVQVNAGSTAASFSLDRPSTGFQWQTFNLGFLGS